jgi:hypothetical protein
MNPARPSDPTGRLVRALMIWAAIAAGCSGLESAPHALTCRDPGTLCTGQDCCAPARCITADSCHVGRCVVPGAAPDGGAP